MRKPTLFTESMAKDYKLFIQTNSAFMAAFKGLPKEAECFHTLVGLSGFIGDLIPAIAKACQETNQETKDYLCNLINKAVEEHEKHTSG